MLWMSQEKKDNLHSEEKAPRYCTGMWAIFHVDDAGEGFMMPILLCDL